MLVETTWYTEPNNRAASNKGSKLKIASRTPVLTVHVCEALGGRGLAEEVGGGGWGGGGVGGGRRQSQYRQNPQVTLETSTKQDLNIYKVKNKY